MSDSKQEQSARKAQLLNAFEYADDYVLENTSCPTLHDVAHGWCDIWANAVKRKAPFVEVRQSLGHWFVVYDGVAYDCDTSHEGFEPPEWSATALLLQQSVFELLSRGPGRKVLGANAELIAWC